MALVCRNIERTTAFSAVTVSATGAVSGAVVDVGYPAKVRVELAQVTVTGTPTSITWWLEFRSSSAGNWYKCHQSPVLALTFDDAYMSSVQYDSYLVESEGMQCCLWYQPSGVAASASFLVSADLVVLRGGASL